MIRIHTFASLFASALVLTSALHASAQTAPGACPPGAICTPAAPLPQARVQVQVMPPPQTVIVQQAPPQAQVAAPPGYSVAVQPQYAAQPQRPLVERRGSRLRWGMVGPGIALIAGGWFGNWITAIPGTITMSFDGREGSDDYFGWGWVPFIGPFVNAGFYAGSPHEGYLAMHLLFGTLQVGGLVLCILGTVLREEVVTMEYALTGDEAGPRLSVMPWASAEGGGAMASIAGF